MAGSFALDISKWVDKVEENLDQALRLIAINMGTEIVLMSPVGNPDLWKSKPPPGYVGGRFRGNWQLSTGSIPQGALDAIDKTGQVSISRIQAAAAGIKPGDVIYVVNNLPYARRLEYGWSTQAPAGMVRVTIARYQQIVDDAAAAVAT